MPSKLVVWGLQVLAISALTEARVFGPETLYDETFPFLGTFAFGTSGGSISATYSFPDPSATAARLLLFNFDNWKSIYSAWNAETLTCQQAQEALSGEILLNPAVGSVTQPIGQVDQPVVYYVMAAGSNGTCGPVTFSYTLTMLQEDGSQFSANEKATLCILWVAFGITAIVLFYYLSGVFFGRYLVFCKFEALRPFASRYLTSPFVITVTVAFVCYFWYLLLAAIDYAIVGSQGFANEGVAIASLIFKGICTVCLLVTATLHGLGVGFTSQRWSRRAFWISMAVLAVYCALYAAASVLRVALLDDSNPSPSFESSWPVVLLVILLVSYTIYIEYRAKLLSGREPHASQQKKNFIWLVQTSLGFAFLALPLGEFVALMAAAAQKNIGRVTPDVVLHILAFVSLARFIDWTATESLFTSQAMRPDGDEDGLDDVYGASSSSSSSSSALLLHLDNAAVVTVGAPSVTSGGNNNSSNSSNSGNSGSAGGMNGSSESADDQKPLLLAADSVREGTFSGGEEDLQAIYRSIGVVMPTLQPVTVATGAPAEAPAVVVVSSGSVPGDAPFATPPAPALAPATVSVPPLSIATTAKLSPGASSSPSLSSSSSSSSSFSSSNSSGVGAGAGAGAALRGKDDSSPLISGRSSQLPVSPTASPGRAAASWSSSKHSASAGSGAPVAPSSVVTSKLAPLSPLASSAAIAAALRSGPNKPAAGGFAAAASPSASASSAAAAPAPAPAAVPLPLPVVSALSAPSSDAPASASASAADNRKSRRAGKEQAKMSREQTASMAILRAAEAEREASAAAAAAAAATNGSGALLDASLLSNDELLGRQSLITGGDLSFYVGSASSPGSAPISKGVPAPAPAPAPASAAKGGRKK